MLILVHSNPIQHRPRSRRHLTQFAFSVLRPVVTNKDAHWHSNEAELFANRVANKLLKVIIHQSLVVHVQEECRGSCLDLH